MARYSELTQTTGENLTKFIGDIWLEPSMMSEGKLEQTTMMRCNGLDGARVKLNGANYLTDTVIFYNFAASLTAANTLKTRWLESAAEYFDIVLSNSRGTFKNYVLLDPRGKVYAGTFTGARGTYSAAVLLTGTMMNSDAVNNSSA